MIAGLLAAVNHSGDGDSTGAIAGNILGAAYSVQTPPADWVADLEALAITNRIVDDLIAMLMVRGESTGIPAWETTEEPRALTPLMHPDVALRGECYQPAGPRGLDGC